MKSKIRKSTEIPGLSYELRASDDGRSYYVVFRYQGAFDGYVLRAGKATHADCSDRASMPGRVSRHCFDAARAIAARLTGQALAAA